MIGYIEGTLLKKEADKILLLVNQIGYEIMLPAVVMETIQDKTVDDKLSFFIYYHQTERSPKPVLIGFNLEIEKDFFQQFISVESIGPLKALRSALSAIAARTNGLRETTISSFWTGVWDAFIGLNYLSFLTRQSRNSLQADGTL